MWKFIVLIFFSLSVEAVELTRNNRFISIQEPSDWTVGKELFGIPYIYFSPEQNGQRSNISFTDTEVEIILNANDLNSTQDIYQTNKKAWAEQVKAEVLKFLPFETYKNQIGHQVYKIGFSFKHDGKKYVEQSFYINCNKRIIFSKALRLSENLSHDKVFQDLIQSLNCGDIK